MVTLASTDWMLPPQAAPGAIVPGGLSPEMNPVADDVVCSSDPFDDFEDDDFDDEFDDDFEEEWDDDLGDDEYADEFPPDEEDGGSGDKFKDDPDFDK